MCDETKAEQPAQDKESIKNILNRFEHIDEELVTLRVILTIANSEYKQLVAWAQKTRRMLEKYMDEER